MNSGKRDTRQGQSTGQGGLMLSCCGELEDYPFRDCRAPGGKASVGPLRCGVYGTKSPTVLWR